MGIDTFWRQGPDPQNWVFVLQSVCWETRATSWFLPHQKILFLVKVMACQSWIRACYYSSACEIFNWFSWKMNFKSNKAPRFLIQMARILIYALEFFFNFETSIFSQFWTIEHLLWLTELCWEFDDKFYISRYLKLCFIKSTKLQSRFSGFFGQNARLIGVFNDRHHTRLA